MFTGIIRETGVLEEARSERGIVKLRIRAPRSRPSLEPGGSIAVDGVCLTVCELDGDSFAADVIPETMKRTRLGEAKPGDRLNLELPLRAGQFLDGHVVQGHVDGTGTVTEAVREEGQVTLTVRISAELAGFTAEKGSVAVNGVSLTVTAVTDRTFSVALIPTTLRETNLDELREGSVVNVEVDVLARYAARREERIQ
ncbi:MAG TPA: riboflavin synthase [bacterium]|nr:riboflavin synthase [bacterium]